AHRTIEWDPTLRKRKTAFYLGDTVALDAVLNAFALEPIHCMAHSLLFDHEGSYGVPFTIPRGAMSGRVEVVLRHATKIKATKLLEEELALIESGQESTLA